MNVFSKVFGTHSQREVKSYHAAGRKDRGSAPGDAEIN